MAFLINPDKFSPCDNLAKESAWRLNKENKIFNSGALESYSFFIERIGNLLEDNAVILENQKLILNSFKDTPAYVFFSEHPEAFYRRIIDKYLWVRKQIQNEKARKINNDPYLQFTKIGIMR